MAATIPATVLSLNPTLYFRLNDNPIVGTYWPFSAECTKASKFRQFSGIHGFYQPYQPVYYLWQPGYNNNADSSWCGPGDGAISVTGTSLITGGLVDNSNTTPFTVNFWFKPDSTMATQNYVLFSTGQTNLANALDLDIAWNPSLNATKARMMVLQGPETTWNVLIQPGTSESDYTVTMDAWNSVGLTWDGVNTMKMYVNGAFYKQYTGSVLPFLDAGILGNDWSGWHASKGGFDEFTYWNGVALNSSQMLLFATPEVPQLPANQIRAIVKKTFTTSQDLQRTAIYSCHAQRHRRQ